MKAGNRLNVQNVPNVLDKKVTGKRTAGIFMIWIVKWLVNIPGIPNSTLLICTSKSKYSIKIFILINIVLLYFNLLLHKIQGFCRHLPLNPAHELHVCCIVDSVQCHGKLRFSLLTQIFALVEVQYVGINVVNYGAGRI